MHDINRRNRVDLLLTISSTLLILFGVIVLHSTARYLFPNYYIYIIIAFILYFVISKVDFDVLSLFSNHLYIFSILLLIATFVIGEVTRGTVRWIPLGGISIQPAEIIRPFILLFFANRIAKIKNARDIVVFTVMLVLPIILILMQPSLSVALLTFLSVIALLISSGVSKKYFIFGIVLLIILAPIFWGIMAPYQKMRIISFINPAKDPLGSGYNSIQSVISVGSGKFFGKGLGKGVQTQLAFLPEKHTDFIFASIAEEMGFVGAGIVILLSLFLLVRITQLMENSKSPRARAYIAAVFFGMLVQLIVNIGMNLGIMPVSGLPFPLVSAGGSSLLATMISLGIINSTKN